MKSIKKIGALVLAAAICCGAIAGCGGNAKTESSAAKKETKTIKIAATPTPHGEILAEAKKILEKDGITLEIKEFTDYVQPNMVVDGGEMDANFFQHKPYLDDFNAENKTKLVSIAAIHYEPLGLYGGKIKSLDALKDGATIAVPNDTTNEARALLLLEAQGIIKLKEGVGVKATKQDIVENKKNVKIEEFEAAQVSRHLDEVDFAVLNGNYALNAGLNVQKDALAKETADSEAAKTYANIIVVKEGNENNEAIKKLCEVLQSEEIKKFINEKYAGAVVPM